MFDLYGRNDIIYSFSCDTSQILNQVYYSNLELFCCYHRKPNTDGHLNQIIFEFVLFKKKKKTAALEDSIFETVFFFGFGNKTRAAANRVTVRV